MHRVHIGYHVIAKGCVKPKQFTSLPAALTWTPTVACTYLMTKVKHRIFTRCVNARWFRQQREQRRRTSEPRL